MELGKHLVEELDLAGRRDTLARWLAHHLAELISDVDRAVNVAEKRGARQRALDAILKVWDHRTQLPGNANPLAPYRKIIQVLSELNPEPLQWFVNTQDNRIAGLYRRFPRLIQVLLARELPRRGKGSAEARKVVHRFLEAEESRLLGLLEVRFLRAGEEPNAAQAEAPVQDEFIRLEQLSNKLIDEMISDLQTLRTDPVPRKSDLQGVPGQDRGLV